MKRGGILEQTFIMIKPDGVERKLIGEIVHRFEQKNFKLVEAKLMNVSTELASRHYEEHKEKPFFGELVEFITSGPVFAMIWEGENAVAVSRMMLGKTNPLESQPGTIRGDFSNSVGNNVIHGSDSLESAKKEIKMWFNK